MSKKNLYSLRDAKSGLYANPNAQQNEAILVRALTELANDPETTPGRHPADFDAYYVGLFDDESGRFEVAEDCPRHVVNLAALVKPMK